MAPPIHVWAGLGQARYLPPPTENPNFESIHTVYMYEADGLTQINDLTSDQDADEAEAEDAVVARTRLWLCLGARPRPACTPLPRQVTYTPLTCRPRPMTGPDDFPEILTDEPFEIDPEWASVGVQVQDARVETVAVEGVLGVPFSAEDLVTRPILPADFVPHDQAVVLKEEAFVPHDQAPVSAALALITEEEVASILKEEATLKEAEATLPTRMLSLKEAKALARHASGRK
jgi:hypothetical protein